MSIVKMLIVTTAHVTQEEAEVLDANGYDRGEYGWLVYVGSDNLPVIPELRKYSPGLPGVIEAARKADCQYVLFDRDAHPLDGVPTYDW